MVELDDAILNQFWDELEMYGKHLDSIRRDQIAPNEPNSGSI